MWKYKLVEYKSVPMVLPAQTTMNTSGLVEKIQELTDLELAVLLCLVTSQHCIIRTEEDGLGPLEQELRLV